MALKELLIQFTANSAPVIAALNNVDAKLRNTTKRLESTSQSFFKLGREVGLLLSAPIAGLGAVSMKAAMDMQALEASLTSIVARFNTGLPVQKAVENEMDFLRRTADRLGVSLQSIQQPYVQYMAASKDSLEDTRKTIAGFLGVSAALGLTSAQTELVIKALSQMQNKGQVMSEELRQQLGDNLPGAISLFSAAMNMSEKDFTQAMSQGKVTSAVLKDVADLIEKQYAAAIQKSSQSVRANLNRVSNAFFLFRASIGKALDETFGVTGKLEAFAKWLNHVTDLFNRLDANGKKVLLTIGLVIGVLGPLLLILGAVVNILRFALSGFLLFGGAIRGIIAVVGFLTTAFRILTVAMAANPIGAFVAASILIVTYWREIVDLFKKAGQFIGKFIPSFDQVKKSQSEIDYSPTDYKPFFSAIGNGINSAVGGFNNFIAERGLLPESFKTGGANNAPQKNYTFNFAAGTSAADQKQIENSVKKAMQKESQDGYYEAIGAN